MASCVKVNSFVVMYTNSKKQYLNLRSRLNFVKCSQEVGKIKLNKKNNIYGCNTYLLSLAVACSDPFSPPDVFLLS